MKQKSYDTGYTGGNMKKSKTMGSGSLYKAPTTGKTKYHTKKDTKKGDLR